MTSRIDPAPIDPQLIAQRKEEYYAGLAEQVPLQELLNENGGLLLARVGNHPPWPARFAEVGEFVKTLPFRTKKARFCVYFFGTRNYGWVHHTAIMAFSDDYTAIKASKKYSPIMIQRAMDALVDAKLFLADLDDNARRFYDRVLEKKDEIVDMPCEICNRVDDHVSPLLLCDGVDCHQNFHMNCLTPPLTSIPPGDWFCPRCLKDSQRQARRQEATAPGEAVGTQDIGNDGSGSGETKKIKKEKTKLKEKHMKRKLHAVRDKLKREPEESPAVVKKAKAQRSPDDSSTDSSPLKTPSAASTPMHAAGKKHAQTTGKTTGRVVELESEERCLICGYGGELVVCEFFKCTKVFHQFCVGSFPFPKDEDATWYCPRHTCVVSGEREQLDAIGTPTIKSTQRSMVKNPLWKCVHCPTAIASDVFPNLPKNQILSKINRSFLCPYCAHGAPLKVQLARHLEKIWSLLATNHEGVPFCGPLLCGVTPPKGVKASRKLDLFRILAKIRRLDYDASNEFVEDIHTIVNDAIAIVGDRSKPLTEAAKTLSLFCSEQMAIHTNAITRLDVKIASVKAAYKNKRTLEEALTGWLGIETDWPIRWRQECGPFEDRYYPTIEARSLDEWTAYVTSASVYVNCENLDKVRPSARSRPRQLLADMDDSTTDDDDTMDTSNQHAGRPDEVKTSTPGGLTLAEGTEVAMALAQLSQRQGGTEKTKLGAWEERELDDIDGRDFFLSPSISEMQQMFDQQSALLRRALESHSALQKAWLVSKQKLLGLGDGVGFSVGEGRLAAELRLANKNLRARLHNKDKLVNQLTTDHIKLRDEVKALEKELAETKRRAGMIEAREDVVMTSPLPTHSAFVDMDEDESTSAMHSPLSDVKVAYAASTPAKSSAKVPKHHSSTIRKPSTPSSEASDTDE